MDLLLKHFSLAGDARILNGVRVRSMGEACEC